MKKISIYLIVFTIICFMSDAALKHSISKELENQSPYYLSFASIGANLLESRMDGWATIKTISSYDEMDKFLINILNHLDLPADNREFHHQNDGDIIFVRYDYSDDMQNYYFLLQTNQAVNATHILITVVD